jgi:putative ABC transport system ATP-binding protein
MRRPLRSRMAPRARSPRSQPLVRRTVLDGLAGGDGRRPPHPVIQVHNVTKVFELGQIRVQALRSVSLQIDSGDLVAIMGSSGSGKTTLMNILGCLDIPTSGRYEIDGVDVSELDEDDLADLRNRKIGFVFQSFNLVARTSALVNVELPLAYAGLRGAERRRRAERALRSVGMGHRLAHQPSELSGGQQQRVAVARAIVTNPALILADEPTGNLDSHSTEDVLRIFARLNEERRTVVLITHEPDVAEQAKRVIRLSDGEVIEDRRLSGLHDAPPAVRRQKSAHSPVRAGAPQTDGPPQNAGAARTAGAPQTARAARTAGAAEIQP